MEIHWTRSYHDVEIVLTTIWMGFNMVNLLPGSGALPQWTF